MDLQYEANYQRNGKFYFSSDSEITKFTRKYINFIVTLDNLGTFSLPASLSPEEGNFRLRLGDSLRIVVPCGNLVHQEDVVLHVVNSLGECSKQTGFEDSMGNLIFDWKAEDTPPGPSQFFFEYKSFHTNDQPTRLNKKCLSVINTVLIESDLRTGNVGLPAKALSVQTVPSCLLGKLDTWLHQLVTSSAYQKYTLIHFTPIQTVGESGSCYSIADHTKIDPSLIPDFLQHKDDAEAWNYLRKIVKDLESSHGVLCGCDLVLNHVASNCPWLRDHPQCGYNVYNTPHLQAAISLDIELQRFASRVVKDEFEDRGVTHNITDEESLSRLMNLLEEEVLKPFHLEEWFEYSFDTVMNDLKAMDISHSAYELVFDNQRDMNSLVDIIYQDSLRTVGVKRKTGIKFNLQPLEGMLGDINKVKVLLQRVQQKLYDISASIGRTILNSIRGYIRRDNKIPHNALSVMFNWYFTCRWHCIEKGAVCDSAQTLIPRYFTPILTQNKETVHLANNGWVMDWDPEKSFMEPEYFIYLSRSLHVWSDCVKLRYGSSPSEIPFLWNYIENYCQLSASIFSSLRLDNCHSTPLHVNEYFLRKCRIVNPQIWIFAELFSGKAHYDYRVERQVGINAFVREAIHCSSAGHLAHILESLSEKPVGSLSPYNSFQATPNREEIHYQTLVPTPATYVLYDCTHDNQVPSEIFTPCHTLPYTAALSISNTVLGSTRGYDEIFPEKLNLAFERRLFHRYDFSKKDETRLPNSSDFILETTHGLEYSTVQVLGSWDNWKTPFSLNRLKDRWVLEMSVPGFLGLILSYPEKVYQYKFLGNGCFWFVDPSRQTVNNAEGTMNNVLDMKLFYKPSEWKPGKPLPGIMEIRRILNQLHEMLISENFVECSTRVLHESVLVVQRHDPLTHRFCLAYAHCAFSSKDIQHAILRYTDHFNGRLERVLLEAYLFVPEQHKPFTNHEYLDGLPCVAQYFDALPPRIYSLLNWFHASYDSIRNVTTLDFTHFPPGAVFIFMTQGCPEVVKNVKLAFHSLDELFPEHLNKLELEKERLLQTFSYVLFSCSPEEEERSYQRHECYKLPQIGQLPYAGIAGVIPLFDSLRYIQTTQRDHPLVKNIVNGNWLVDYMLNRLDVYLCRGLNENIVTNLWKIAQWLRQTFFYPHLCLPRVLFVYYTDLIFSTLYAWIARRVVKMCFTQHLIGCYEFISSLCLATLQFHSFIPSAALESDRKQSTMAAGLPHFATEWRRCWGRDTFIAFKGCFLVTKRFLAAKQLLVSYAQVVRHGLIPNLLGSQSNPRYNARDVTWFFIQAVQDYCLYAPEKENFLTTKINLLHSLESHSPWAFRCFTHRNPPFNVISFSELLHYLFASHVYGFNVREFNAGPSLDSHMQDQGFEISVSVDLDTGLVYGGNAFNCGTWMDKMGTSKKAGNDGIPATPRDGAAVEINGLVKSALRFVNRLPESVFPFSIIDAEKNFTYALWEEKLQENFDTLFFIHPLEEHSYIHSSDPKETLHLTQEHVFHTGIYRDTVGCFQKSHDYRLRPNFCIAQAVAPELFPKNHFEISHNTAASILIPKLSVNVLQEHINRHLEAYGRDALTLLRVIKESNLNLEFTKQLGIKTLSPMDSEYNEYYDNSNESTDPRVAHGFNYHNGPEWLWILGYFLQSMYFIYAAEDVNKMVEKTTWRQFLFNSMQYLYKIRYHLLNDPWRSLPELTNNNGQVCPFSCPAQAWSVGTILNFLHHVIYYNMVRQTLPNEKTL